MNSRSQIVCAWCGIFCLMFMGNGLFPAAGFLPPHAPSANAEEIAAIYQAHASGIRFGTVLILIAGALYAPYTAAIAAQMRRIEYAATPVLTYTQLATGTVGSILIAIPALIWAAAAFRPERDPQITQMLNDLGWIFFVMPVILPAVQSLALGFCIIGDRRSKPIYPRWVGFLNFWAAVLFLPAFLLPFFKTGPFAWDGIIVFWVPAAMFLLLMSIVSIYTIKAVRQQALELDASEPAR